MPTPIFVVGAPRSGTSWLSQQLALHPEIAAVLVEENNSYNLNAGIYESYFFSHLYNRYGDISHKPSFIEFLEVFSATDYFKFIGADKNYLYSMWPTTYENIYRSVMDKFAEAKNSAYWIDKTPTHTPLIDQISCFYPDALFIGIKRNVEDVVTSRLKIFVRSIDAERDNHTIGRIIRKTVYEWVYYNKIIDRFQKNSRRLLKVNYEDMKRNLETEMRTICNFLNIDFHTKMLKTAYGPYTGFEKNDDRSKILLPHEKRLINYNRNIYEIVPVNLFLLKRFVPHRFRRRGRLLFMFACTYPYERNGQRGS